MLKKPENRLPTRAAQKRGHVFACTCRAATVRERRPLPILPLLLAALCLAAGSAAGQGQAPEAAATQPPVGEWQSLFDGKSLAGWKETPFSGHGPVRIENEAIILGAGVMPGVTWTKCFPTSNYEIRLDAARHYRFAQFIQIAERLED